MRYVAELSAAQQAELEAQWKAGATHRERVRAQAVLLSAQGLCLEELAALLGAERDAVGRWLTRWEKGGVAALADRPRKGRPRALDKEAQEQLVSAAQASPASPRAELAKRGR